MRTESTFISALGRTLLCLAALVAAPASAEIVTFEDYVAAQAPEREAFFRDKFCKGVDIKSFYDSLKASEDEEAKKAFMEMQAKECSRN